MTVLLGAAGRRRSPVTMPGYHAGRPPGNKGMRYPADPPTIDEIVAVMRHAGDDRHGWRLRAMLVVLWRAGLGLQEALALAEHDLDQRRGSLLSAAARAAADARSAWTTGAGNSCAHSSPPAPSCPSGRSSASSTAAPAVAPGRPPTYALGVAGSIPTLAILWPEHRFGHARPTPRRYRFLLRRHC
jgi:hypothetical protein